MPLCGTPLFTKTGAVSGQGALSINGLMYAALAARKIGMHPARPLSNVLEKVYYICRKGYQSVPITKRRIAMNPVTTSVQQTAGYDEKDIPQPLISECFKRKWSNYGVG